MESSILKNIEMQRVKFWLALSVLLTLTSGSCLASNLTLNVSGRVSVELLSADAAFRNTLSLTSPAAGIDSTGCKLEAAGGLAGVLLLSETISQHGCRVDLDADTGTPGIQTFASGTVLEFGMCAQTDADPACEFIWSSDPTDNSDGDDHVMTTEFSPNAYTLAWEDLENLGDNDFNDLIVVVRVVQDSDGDGLWDDWESNGIDTTGDGVINLDLPALGADPQHKDIFLEIDFMNCTTAGGDCTAGDNHSHVPKQDAIDALISAFDNAPVTNPDGNDGITLHVDVDDAIPHQEFLSVGCGHSGPTIGLFNDAKATNFGTNSPRRFAYHYAIVGHRQAPTTLSSGCGERPGNDFLMTLGAWNNSCISDGPDDVLDSAPAGDDVSSSTRIYAGPDLICDTAASGDDTQLIAVGNSRMMDIDGDGLEDRTVGTVQQQAGTLMHEFGHNLNLRHGGNEAENRKPNYISIMNYAFQIPGIAPNDPDGPGPLAARIDYSFEDLPDLNENNLNETAGVGDGGDNTQYFCPNGSSTSGPAMGPIDWNCNMTSNDIGVIQDINNDAATAVLTGFDDWANIKYDFQNTSDFDDGDHSSTANLVEVDSIVAFPPVADAGQVADGNPDSAGDEYACELGDSIGLDGSGSFDHNGVIIAYDWDFVGYGGFPPSAIGPVPAFNCSFNVGIFPVALTVTDDDDQMTTDPADVDISVNAGPDQMLECTSFDGAEAILGANLPNNTALSYEWTDSNGVTIGTTSSITPTVPLGVNPIDVTVTDLRGVSRGDEVVVTVVDTTPPVIDVLTTDPSSLWPPNHKLIPITVTVSATDICDPNPVIALSTITMNEGDETNTFDPNIDTNQGDGNTTNDIVVDNNGNIFLRAERQGGGNGRIYSLTYTATDSSGNTSNRTVIVTVPHNQ